MIDAGRGGGLRSEIIEIEIRSVGVKCGLCEKVRCSVKLSDDLKRRSSPNNVGLSSVRLHVSL